MSWSSKLKIILMLLLAFPAFAFAATLTYSCNYPKYANPEGLHKVKEKFELNFIVDKTANKSYMLGNNGSSEVKRLAADDQVVFLELTYAGSIMSTTIDSELNSVHSRNTVISGSLIPSQYYGKCSIK
jgi:hypothetical protein